MNKRNDHPSHRTPNLNYNIQKQYGDSIKWEKKIDFNDFRELSEIDLSDTYLENKNNVICATALKLNENKLRIHVYRYDFKDYKKEDRPINLDEYILHRITPEWVKTGNVLKSTECNQNMVDTITEYSFAVETNKKNISDHHSTDLPGEVIDILDIYKLNYDKLVREGIIKSGNS